MFLNIFKAIVTDIALVINGDIVITDDAWLPVLEDGWMTGLKDDLIVSVFVHVTHAAKNPVGNHDSQY